MKIIKLTAFLSLVALGISSCKKDDRVGNDIQPSNLNLLTTDTVTVVAETMPGDTFPSRNLNNNYLGVINDPIYGKTRSSIFSQFLLPDTIEFSGSVSDSVILYLPYKTGSYGDMATTQRIQVFQMSADLPSSAFSDYSESGKIDSTNILADLSFTPSSISVITVLGNPVRALRVALDTAILGAKFRSAASSNLIPANWTNYFKGLFIKTVDQPFTTEKGSALNFDIETANLVYYYKRSGDTLVHAFPAAGAVRVNQVLHTRIGSQAASNYGEQNSDTLFILGQGGQKIRLTFPYLNELKKLNPRGTTITVNKADLKIEQIYSGSSTFTESKELGGYVLNANNTSGVLVTNATRVINSYTLPVGSYIQEAINGTKEKGMILRLTADDVSAQRMMLSGKNNIKLVLTLTKL